MSVQEEIEVLICDKSATDRHLNVGRDLSAFEMLPVLVHRKLFKMLNISGLKALRLASTTFRGRIENEVREAFKVWDIDKHSDPDPDFVEKKPSPQDLRRFSTEVKTIKSLRFSPSLETVGVDQAINSLIEDHPELEEMHLRLEDLGDQQVFKDIVTVCGHMLKSLQLDHSYFYDEQISLNAGCLPCLQNFKMTGMLDTEVAKVLSVCCGTLRKLELIQTGYFEDPVPNNLAFPQLEHLDLEGWYESITEQELAQMLNSIANTINGQGARLKVLKLKGVENIGDSFSNTELAFSAELKEVVLSNIHLNDNDLVSILSKVGKSLMSLDLSSANITGGGALHKIVSNSFPHMESFNASMCSLLTDYGLVNILSKFGSDLKILELEMTSITGENFVNLNTSYCLKSLDLSSCKHLTDIGLESIIEKSGPTLEILNLRNTNITAEGLTKILLKYAIKLKDLNLAECTHMTNCDLISILLQCGESLENLNIARTGVSGSGFLTSGVSLPKLRTLEIASFEPEKLKDAGLREIHSTCRILETLNISYFSDISKAYQTELRHNGIVIEKF